jgi:DNA processing protein
MNSDAVLFAALTAAGADLAGVKAYLTAGGTPESLFSASPRELQGVHPKVISAAAKADRSAAELMLKRVEKCGAEILTFYDPAYPALLKEISDPPLLLFIKGNRACLNEFCVSIVGSRKSSRIGINIAAEIAGDLARCGVTVISGFAFGIDIAAHLAAAKKGSTAAVLGSGFEHIYPREHIKYLDKICEQGCVLTEFLPDERPVPYNFPKRNRVISGLAKGVVICEAAQKSGSLITARLAMEQNREVFAVPASPLSINNAANRLIKDGAVLTESYLDIIHEYKDIFAGICGENDLYTPAEEHRALWEKLKVEPFSMDELAAEMDYSSLILSITALEIEGVIEKNSEGRYAILRK